MVKLEPIQKKTLELFAKSELAKRFYLTGGTLLACCYLHHRKSEDLDFFTSKPFDYDEVNVFVEYLKKALGFSKVEKNKIYDRWEFFLQNGEKLKIEFVLYEHKRLSPRKRWQGVVVDSLDDITANKVMALFDRNNYKDLVDLYFLFTRKGYKVSRALKLAKEKFGLSVSRSSFWSESLKTFNSLNQITPFLFGTAVEKKQLIEEIKEYFADKSNIFLEKVLDEAV